MSTVKSSKNFFSLPDMEWEQVDPLLKRQIHGYDDKIMLVVADFEAGGVGAMHNHPHSQVTYVASGEFEMTIGDEVRIIRAGDSYYVPPMAMHGCTCLKAGRLIDVFSPLREDFLEG
ncbi:MAG: cupin domain-containing protein [Bacteroidetes bacterium]|nr:MAG: cupin domain-containing protein [Bacteroidota bacterium]